MNKKHYDLYCKMLPTPPGGQYVYAGKFLLSSLKSSLDSGKSGGDERRRKRWQLVQT